MKKIVLSAIVALVVTVGVHQVALLMGASELAAVAVAGAAAVAVAGAAFAFAAFAFAFAPVAAFAAFAFAAVAFTFVFAPVAVAAAVVVAKEERVRFRWVVPVYATECLAAWSALTVGNVGWSAAIALSGIAALLALWHAHSRFAAPDAPLAVSAVSEQNGA